MIGQVYGKVRLASWKSTEHVTRVIKAEHTLSFLIHSSSSDPVNTMTELEESPTRYMLPDSEDHLGQMIEPRPAKKTKKEKTKGEGYVDYSLNDLSPARYPTFNQKRKKSKKKKDKKVKKEPGKFVQFRPTVHLICSKKQQEEIDLTNEEDYPSRVTAFALKRKGQKELLKYQHQYRSLTPRRLSIQKHIRDTLQRENGNQSSSSSPQTPPPTNSIPMNS